MSRKLVAYFSASGVTAKVAESLSDALGADLFEIVPKVRYKKADLDWRDKTSRSTIEMNDPSSRPEIESLRDNVADYDTIYVGFPIWWYVAPAIINMLVLHGDKTEYVMIACKGVTITKRSMIFGEEKYLPFEDGKFPAICDHEGYLTLNYGDWRADLPEDQQRGHDLKMGEIE